MNFDRVCRETRPIFLFLPHNKGSDALISLKCAIPYANGKNASEGLISLYKKIKKYLDN